MVATAPSTSGTVANVTGFLARVLEGRAEVPDAEGLLRELGGAG